MSKLYQLSSCLHILLYLMSYICVVELWQGKIKLINFFPDVFIFCSLQPGDLKSSTTSAVKYPTNQER